MRTKATLAALSAAALVAACGGGGDHNTPLPTSEVPASASASAGGFIDYLRKLVASTADMLEPVDTAAVTGPTDDTGEPQKVD
ncbi:MAG: hypothetical protein ABIQ06_04320 [Caldimonas sp.]